MKMAVAMLLVGSLVVFSGPAFSSQPAPLIDLVGQVTDATTGDPVEMADVFIAEQRLATQTTREGAFRLRVLATDRPIQLTIRHNCYHTVRVEVNRNADVYTHRLEIGLPFYYEKYTRYSPPLGACRQE